MILYHIRVLLLLYLIIAAQDIFYLLAFRKAFSGLSLKAFAEQRKAFDGVIAHRLKMIYGFLRHIKKK